MALHARHTYLNGGIEYSGFRLPVVVTQASITGTYISYPASSGRNTLLFISYPEHQRQEYEPPAPKHEFQNVEYEPPTLEPVLPNLEYEPPASESVFPKLEYELPTSEIELLKSEVDPLMSFPGPSITIGHFSICYIVHCKASSACHPYLHLRNRRGIGFSLLLLLVSIRLHSPEFIYNCVNKSIGVPGTLNFTTNTKNLLL